MNGKIVILIIIIATLIGIGLAWFFLHALPSNIKEQSLIESTIIYTNHCFTTNIVQ